MTTCNVHLGLIGKRVVDFLLVLIDLFSLGITVEALQAIIGSKSAISFQRGPVDPKFRVKGVASTNRSSQKTRLNDLSHGIKICTVRRTDGRTEFSSKDRVCIPCSEVKTRVSHPAARHA